MASTIAPAVACASHSSSLTEVDRAIGAERHALAQLLLRLRRPEREHNDFATLPFDDPHGLLDTAFLVWRDRETEVARLDRLRVVGEHHLPARDRDPLHRAEDPHALTFEFSGSKTGVESFVATVTGYCSPMYSTSNSSPTLAFSGGR